ncbi:hypothetical protein [Metabacillus fastidiosus]|uniref:hypothetical protein n=1 Tax=Metabacillus fastidiosus TaxID=1458 RepID=UPI002E1F2176|nr:hypothetical protein [Metabacillus fastidiosus]
MGNSRPRRSRALVVVDDLFVRADNIIIVGDRDRDRDRDRDDDDRVAGVEDDNRRRRHNDDVRDTIDDILDEVCRRRR